MLILIIRTVFHFLGRHVGKMALLSCVVVPCLADENRISEFNMEKTCGQNSLYVAAKLLGYEWYYDQIKTAFPEDKNAYVSIRDIATVAKKLGMNFRVRRQKLAAILSMDDYVCILYKEPAPSEKVGHFLCARKRGDGIQFIDPPDLPVLLSADGLTDERIPMIIVGRPGKLPYVSPLEWLAISLLAVCITLILALCVRKALR